MHRRSLSRVRGRDISALPANPIGTGRPARDGHGATLRARGRLHRGKSGCGSTSATWTTSRIRAAHQRLGRHWTSASFATDKLYVVQTNDEGVERCHSHDDRPGRPRARSDMRLGTTAYVAEQWGRRWITIDTSRVPLALARQRLLTATFPYYELQDDARGPAGGFVYKRRQNTKGEEVGGIVPHVTLKSIANDEPPAEEVLVDRPEVDSKITRVSGPFVVEATIPTPVDYRRRRRSRTRAFPEDASLRRPHARGAAPQPVAPARRQPDDHAAERPAAGAVADALGRGGARAGRRAGRDRLRPGERRGQREARLRGRARGAPEGATSTCS